MDPSKFTRKFSIELKDSDEAIYFKDESTSNDLVLFFNVSMENGL